MNEENGMEKKKYEQLSDEELAALAQHEDNSALDFLIAKYKNFIKVKAHPYFIIGADKEDIIQEGMIGLYKAIRDYKSDKAASFYSFADICVTRQIITAIKNATRQKHMPLNTYVSLNDKFNEDDSEKSYLDILPGSTMNNPEEIMINREDKDHMELLVGAALSELECKVLVLFLQGMTYLEVADILLCTLKVVDNALQRVRRKVEKIMAEKNLELM